MLADRQDSVGTPIHQTISGSGFVTASSVCDWLWSGVSYPKLLVVLKNPTPWHTKLPETSSLYLV